MPLIAKCYQGEHLKYILFSFGHKDNFMNDKYEIYVMFFNCEENAKPRNFLQLPHYIADYLEPTKNAQYYLPLQMVICDEYTKQNKQTKRTENHS